MLYLTTSWVSSAALGSWKMLGRFSYMHFDWLFYHSDTTYRLHKLQFNQFKEQCTLRIQFLGMHGANWSAESCLPLM
jgi:hypothetical protein